VPRGQSADVRCLRHTRSMEWRWGDVPAWVAIAISIAAGLRAWWAGRRAREAMAGTASLEVSLQRIADIMQKGQTLRVHAEALSAPPRPAFTVEFVSDHSYRLRNVGDSLATGVTLNLPDFPAGSTRALPDDVELPPLASTALFVIRGAWGDPVPGDVTVECDQLTEPVRVPLPPRG
jgi:hypothetical protein